MEMIDYIVAISVMVVSTGLFLFPFVHQVVTRSFRPVWVEN